MTIYINIYVIIIIYHYIHLGNTTQVSQTQLTAVLTHIVATHYNFP